MSAGPVESDLGSSLADWLSAPEFRVVLLRRRAAVCFLQIWFLPASVRESVRRGSDVDLESDSVGKHPGFWPGGNENQKRGENG